MGARTPGRLIVAALLCAPAPARADCLAPDCVKIVSNDDPGPKLRLAIVGDGYQAGESDTFVADVERMLHEARDGLFELPFFQEAHNAFVIYRIFQPSSTALATVGNEGAADTAFDFVWNGQAENCWVNLSTAAENALHAAVTASIGAFDKIVVLLNTTGGSGCARNDWMALPRSQSGRTLAHELGHGIGQLGDEYPDLHTLETVTMPRNCTTLIARSAQGELPGLTWRRYVSRASAIATEYLGGMSATETVGEFKGCGRNLNDLFRPVENCRMRDPYPEFCTVCVTFLHNTLDPAIHHDFSRLVAGNFTGGGEPDLLVHNHNDLALLQHATGQFRYDSVWFANNIVPASTEAAPWRPHATDVYVPADFDGDSLTDVFVLGPGWAEGNQTFPASLGLLRSTGTGFLSVVRYDTTLAGFWSLSGKDRLVAGNFVPDAGRPVADLVLWNPTVGGQAYLGLLRSNGGSLSGLVRYTGGPPGWPLHATDGLQAADLDADGLDDLIVLRHPTTTGEPGALGLLRATGGGFVAVQSHVESVFDWPFRAGDELRTGDFDADGKADVYLLNTADWPQPRLLMLRSTGGALQRLRAYGLPANSLPALPLDAAGRTIAIDVDRDRRPDLLTITGTTGGALRALRLGSDGLGASPAIALDSFLPLGPGTRLVPFGRDVRGSHTVLLHDAERIALLEARFPRVIPRNLYFRWIDNPLTDSTPWTNLMP